jgi:hypothetical protein
LLSVTGNVTANNGMFTNIVNVASHTGSVVSVTGNVNGGNVIAAANVTTANLTVTGISNLNSNANVVITGGTANYALVTNGSGVLSWANASGISGAVTGTIAAWTPQLFATGGGTFTYTTQNGTYLKNGQSVTAFFTITISGVSGVSGTVRIANLPVAAYVTTPGAAGGGELDNYSFAVLPSGVTGVVPSGSQYMDLYWHDRSGSNNTLAQMTTGQLGTTATLIGRITYISAS